MRVGTHIEEVAVNAGDIASFAIFVAAFCHGFDGFYRFSVVIGFDSADFDVGIAEVDFRVEDIEGLFCGCQTQTGSNDTGTCCGVHESIDGSFLTGDIPCSACIDA